MTDKELPCDKCHKVTRIYDLTEANGMYLCVECYNNWHNAVDTALSDINRIKIDDTSNKPR